MWNGNVRGAAAGLIVLVLVLAFEANARTSVGGREHEYEHDPAFRVDEMKLREELFVESKVMEEQLFGCMNDDDMTAIVDMASEMTQCMENPDACISTPKQRQMQKEFDENIHAPVAFDYKLSLNSPEVKNVSLMIANVADSVLTERLHRHHRSLRAQQLVTTKDVQKGLKAAIGVMLTIKIWKIATFAVYSRLLTWKAWYIPSFLAKILGHPTMFGLVTKLGMITRFINPILLPSSVVLGVLFVFQRFGGLPALEKLWDAIGKSNGGQRMKNFVQKSWFGRHILIPIAKPFIWVGQKLNELNYRLRPNRFNSSTNGSSIANKINVTALVNEMNKIKNDAIEQRHMDDHDVIGRFSKNKTRPMRFLLPVAPQDSIEEDFLDE